MMNNKLLGRMETLSAKDIGKELVKYIEPDNLITDFGGNVKFSTSDNVKLWAEWAERNEERLISPGRE